MHGLLAKELRQHRVLLLLLFLCLESGFVLGMGNGRIRQVGGSNFWDAQLYFWTLFPLASLLLGNALIASEFRQKTQLFLEGLPLARWKMLFVKYTLGLFFIFFAAVVVVAVAWWSGRGTEAMTPRFALNILLKTTSWVWFLYALFFAHAFLGRYRIAIGVFVLIVSSFLSEANVEVGSFGPFRLVDNSFPYERQVIPWDALAVTGGLILLLTALGFGCGLVRDGGVAELLAERMSLREKVVIILLVMCSMSLSSYVKEHVTHATPVMIPGANEEISEVAQVRAAAAVDTPTDQETRLTAQVAKDTLAGLTTLSTYLGGGSFPPVFIVHRRDLAANEFQNGGLEFVQGLMVRVNLAAPGFEPARLQAWITREILIVRTLGLASRERNAWVLDGFSVWWPNRSRVAQTAGAWHRTGKSVPPDFNDQLSGRWYSLRQGLGEENARALAAVGLAALAERQGEEACRQFLAASFAPRPSADLQVWLRDVLDPPAVRLRRTTQISWDDYIREWRGAAEKGAVP